MTKLRAVYEIEEKKKGLFMTRKRVAGNRGMLRIFFPMLVTKVTFGIDYVKYRTRLDGVAFLILIVALAAVLMELFLDRTTHPREYDPVFPFAFLGWYVVLSIIEAVRTSKLFKAQVVAESAA